MMSEQEDKAAEKAEANEAARALADKPLLVCSRCGRRAYTTVGAIDKLDQPDGSICGGIFGYKRDPLSPADRRDRAREATKEAVARELMWAAIGSRIWPSYLFEPSKPQKNLPAMLCIKSPAGPICYRLTVDELVLFEHVTDRRKNGPRGYMARDKEAALMMLATEGWA